MPAIEAATGLDGRFASIAPQALVATLTPSRAEIRRQSNDLTLPDPRSHA